MAIRAGETAGALGLLERLKAGKRNRREIAFPGIEGARVMLQVLSNQETQEAIIASEYYMTRIKIAVTPSSIDFYTDVRSSEILWRALRDPEDPTRPVAISADELRRQITMAEKEALIAAYQDLEKESSPNFTAMKAEDFQTLWDDLKKNATILSSSLSIGTLRGLVIYLASLPPSSPTGSGST